MPRGNDTSFVADRAYALRATLRASHVACSSQTCVLRRRARRVGAQPVRGRDGGVPQFARLAGGRARRRSSEDARRIRPVASAGGGAGGALRLVGGEVAGGTGAAGV